MKLGPKSSVDGPDTQTIGSLWAGKGMIDQFVKALIYVGPDTRISLYPEETAKETAP